MIAAPPPALSVSPARIELASGARHELRVTNAGGATAVVEVGRAGFALDLRGRPRIVVRREAALIRVRPARLVLRPDETASVTVSSANGASPGDHPALVLLSTRPARGPAVSVRLRVGVIVVVHAPGTAVHRLTVVRAQRSKTRVELLLANRGNVLERVLVVARRDGRVVARVTRDILPRSVAAFALPRRTRAFEVRSEARLIRRAIR